MNPRPAVLVIAGSDSSGGAGLLRDVQTLAHFNVDALCAVTAVTAQSNSRVLAVHHVPPETIRAQIDGALETRPVGAIKIGMLGTAATVEAVADALGAVAHPLEPVAGAIDAGPHTFEPAVSAPSPRASVPIVLDTVLLSSSGGVLLDPAGREAMLERLFPHLTLLTPNIPEAAALLGERPATDEAALIAQAQRLLTLGPKPGPTGRARAHRPPPQGESGPPTPFAGMPGPTAVLLKGGHAIGAQAVDLLVTREGAVERLVSTRVAASLRGTGCALASAIAAGLASGLPLIHACRQAKSHLQQLLSSATASA